LIYFQRNLQTTLFFFRISAKMKNYDLKHIAFHVLVGLYFIWLMVFAVLLSMGLGHANSNGSIELSKVYLLWIFLNVFMGTSMFIVLRLFRNKTLLGKIITYSYCIAVIAAAVGCLMISRVI